MLTSSPVRDVDVERTEYKNAITCFSLCDRTIDLLGNGECVIPPDRARLIIVILYQKQTPDEVVKSVQKRLDYITGTMMGFGVKEKDMKITRSLIQQEKQYIMQVEVNAVFHNLENCQTVAIQLTQKLDRSVSVSMPQFFHSANTLEKGKRRATLEAIKNCHDKAVELASIFGAKVSKPILISEHYNKLVPQDDYIPTIHTSLNNNSVFFQHSSKQLIYVAQSKVTVKFQVQGEYKKASFKCFQQEKHLTETKHVS